MRKSREGIGRLGAVLFLCLVLSLSAHPVCAEPGPGAVKTESKGSGPGAEKTESKGTGTESGEEKTEAKGTGTESGAVKTETRGTGTESDAEKTGSTVSGEETPDVPLTEHTQAEAVEWLHSMVGVSIDYDGAYGAQCVDFIKAYYDWLGVEAAHGDAQDYRSNRLPDGFTRIENADPMPGDVLIYTGGNYGHVGIFESEFASYHQNWGQPYVQELTARYDAISDARYYWGVIRPCFPEYVDPVLTEWTTPDGMTEGQTYRPRGVVSCPVEIVSVTLAIIAPDGKTVCSREIEGGVRELDLFQIAEIDVTSLSPGIYEYVISAKTAVKETELLRIYCAVYADADNSRTMQGGNQALRSACDAANRGAL